MHSKIRNLCEQELMTLTDEELYHKIEPLFFNDCGFFCQNVKQRRSHHEPFQMPRMWAKSVHIKGRGRRVYILRTQGTKQDGDIGAGGE